jgi:uncharacterized repeat protein (TIGR03803 family)
VKEFVMLLNHLKLNHPKLDQLKLDQLKVNHRNRHHARIILSTLLAVAALLVVPHAAQAQTVTTILNFPNTATAPLGAIAQGRDGDYYGLTLNGDAVYKVTAAGTFTLLTGIPQSEGQGCNGLVLGTDGNFYGTCFGGGNNGNSTGTFIKVTPAGTLTVLHFFDGSTVSVNPDGCYPVGVPLQASDGNFYGTAQSCGEDSHGLIASGMAYKITPAGVFTALHGFDGGATDGAQPTGTLIQGSDGNLWGTTNQGGQTGSGTIFKMTLAGAVTVLYQFSGCGTGTIGCNPYAGLVQGTDGNYYGVAEGGGTNGQGIVFRVAPSGVLTVLHNFNETVDNGGYPRLPLTLGTDGNFYGVATGCAGGGCSAADIFKITSKGVFTDLYDFPNAHNNNNSLPYSPLLLGTNGTFYSTTEMDGTSGTGSSNTGTFFSLADGQKAFIVLQESSGKVGSKIGILGQGFSAASVVKFNGVTVTAVTRTGTTFLTATVPAGATDGFVTVTTGATTLTSSKKFVVHNSWATGAPMPVAAVAACSAVLNGQIYVVGGYNGSAQTAVQIYNPTTNKWTTGTALSSGLSNQACAAVNGEVYEFGGTPNTGGSQTNAVLAYNPATKTWSSKSAMPTARQDIVAVVANNLVYVIGGYNGNRVSTVEAYNPATDTWSTESSALVAQSGDVGGVIAGNIVISGGAGESVDTGDTESYSVSGNAWTSLKADATVRNNPCGGVVGAALYVAGGANRSGSSFTVNEAFTPSKDAWTTLAPLPQATTDPASAVSGGQLFCFGGFTGLGGATLNNVQIYQP